MTSPLISNTQPDSFNALLNNGTPIGTILGNLNVYKNNPSGIQRTILAYLEQVTNGTATAVDPSNPFVYLLEASSVSTASFIVADETNTRQLYPALAQTQDDLYRHMSDTDYIGRFSTPSTTTFDIYINQAELISKMVIDPTTNLPTATIPRNTVFNVANVNFSMSYPINIQLMSYGGLQITYDTTITSPLQTLNSNAVNWTYRTPVGGNDPWIQLTVPVQQFTISSTQSALTTASVYSEVLPLTANYYYTRVYYMGGTATTWTEIATTHTQQVYDIATPTALLQVIDGQSVTVTIPQIYITTGTISGTLRVDVYQTQGPMTLIMENYQLGAFTAQWLAIDVNDQTPAASVFNTLQNMAIFSTDVVVGGTDPISFTQLREQVITNSVGPVNIPITNVQIANALADNGYQIVSDIDIVTNRVFLATRTLPDPVLVAPDADGVVLLTAAATSVETLIMSATALSAHPSVLSNGNRITISPSMIYQMVNGIVTPVNETDLVALKAMSTSSIASAVNSNSFIYTPFHYVLDMSTNTFNVRPYYLNSPDAVAVTFVNNNNTSGIQVNSSTYSLAVIPGGYQLSIVVTSNAAWKAIPDNQVQAILAYTPPSETNVAYLLGTLAATNTSGERIFQFNIYTNYDLDSSDNLYLTSFSMFNTIPKIFGTPLFNAFSIFYTSNETKPTGWLTSIMDASIPTYLVPTGTFAITEELITLQFGTALPTLWARARTSVSQTPFQTYPADVPLIYTQDVYAIDSKTGGTVSFVNGVPTFTKIHSAGDPVLNPTTGLPTYAHRAGDVMMDNNGIAIPTAPADLIRQIDMFFIDAAYYFATDAAAVNYRTTILDTVVGWLTNDLETLSNNLLEQTNLYFYPQTTMGLIDVMIEDGVTTSIEARQNFTLNLYVNDAVYNDSSLQATITQTTITTLDNLITNSQVTISNITTALGAIYGNDVIGFNITGLGGSADLSALTVINNSQQLSLAKNLVALPDGSLVVQDAVTVNYIRHVVPNTGANTFGGTSTTVTS